MIITTIIVVSHVSNLYKEHMSRRRLNHLLSVAFQLLRMPACLPPCFIVCEYMIPTENPILLVIPRGESLVKQRET